MTSFGWHTTSGNVIVGDSLALKHHHSALAARLRDVRREFSAERYERAHELAFAILKRAPGHPEANFVAGVCAKRLHGNKRGLPFLEVAAQHDPLDKERAYALAVTYAELGEPEHALEWIERALVGGANDARVQFRYALILTSSGRMEEARAAFEEAVRLDDQRSLAWSAFGNALRSDGELVRAIQCYQRGADLEPFEETLYGNAAVSFQELGDFSAALELSRIALALDPFNRLYLSNYLLALNYLPGLTPSELADEHDRFGLLVRYSGPVASAPVARQHSPELSVGLISPDFRQHPVAAFVEPLLRHASAEKLRIVCYYDYPASDAVTERLRALGQEWRHVSGMSDEEVAARIEADNVDVLLDLAGHTSANRLSLYIKHLAPVQGSWLGYPGGTGVAALSFRLTDELCEPVEADSHAREENGLLCMESPFLCFTPPDVIPDPSARVGERCVRFICLNNVAKISAPVLEAWAEIMRRVGDATLVLKSRLLVEEGALRVLRDRIRLAGIDVARVELHPPEDSFADHLRYYDRADIALDTFPYNGTTTTCEALWMGVPLVAVRGNTHAGCVSAGLLESLGFAAELVADDVHGYVDKAVALASDPEGRQMLRQRITGAMPQARLTDAADFTARFASAMRHRLEAMVPRRAPVQLVVLVASKQRYAGWLCNVLMMVVGAGCRHLGNVDEAMAWLEANNTEPRNADDSTDKPRALLVVEPWDLDLTVLERARVGCIYVEGELEWEALRRARTNGHVPPWDDVTLRELAASLAFSRTLNHNHANLRVVSESRLQQDPAPELNAICRWLGWPGAPDADVLPVFPPAPSTLDALLDESTRQQLLRAIQHGTASAAPMLVQTQSADSLPIRLPDGTWIQTIADIRALTTYVLLEQGDWFEPELAFVRTLLKPGMRVLDVGANHGVYALSAARAVGRDGYVWAVEPGRSAATRLMRASLVPGGSRVAVLNIALGDNSGTGFLSNGTHSELRAIGTSGDTVPIDTLDAVADEHGIHGVDFMKLDVEGAELSVIAGAEQWLAQNEPVIQLEIKAGAHVDLRAARTLEDAGFSLYQLVPGLNVLTPLVVPVDTYALNVYALRAHAVAALAERGLLTDTPADSKECISAPIQEWTDGLGSKRYAAHFMPHWRHRAIPPDTRPHTLYAALGYYAAAHADDSTPGDAVKALCQSATLFAAAAEAAGPNDVLRRLSLVTVQLELGWRGAALTTLEKVIRRIDRLPDPASEPFLVPIAHYADMTPNDPWAWLHALLRATWQRVAVFSSWHAQRDSLANLDAFMLTGINDPWMQRAHTLLRVLAEGDSQAYDPRTWPHDKTEPFDMLPRWPGWLRGRLPAA